MHDPRTRRTARALAAAGALALGWLIGGGRGAAAVEGKWTPEQVLELDPAWLRSLGLAVAPERLWQPGGGGLLEAAVRIGGCSASFVSAQGLLITNHHCAFGILQQHSTPARDLITSGYLAAGRDQELPGANLRATLPRRTTDVSAAITAAAAVAGGDDLARYRAIERRQKELVAACEHQEGSAARRCEVATFDGGVRYLLIESLEYPDVRLVYAPPRAVGDFGGEVDNWSWPRHSGDFALLRVYAGPDGRPAPRAAGNQPLRPPHYFPVAADGIRPGDFVMVAGYPGITFRSLTAPEMRERAELYYPRRAELLRAWLDLMEAAARADAAARIALADRIKALANAEKNARGQIAGLRRGRVLEEKGAEDREVLTWAAASPAPPGTTRGATSAACAESTATMGCTGGPATPAHPASPLTAAGAATAANPAVAAYQELSRLVEGRLAGWDRDFLLEQAHLGPKPLDLAMTLVRHARESVKPDLEREPPFMERNHDRLVEGLRRDQSRLSLPADGALLADLLQRFADLPEGMRLPAVESLLAGLPPGGGTGSGPATRCDRAALAARAAALVAGSRVTGLEERLKMLGENEEQLRARRDPLLELAAGLDTALHDVEERDRRFRGAASRLRPAWRRAVAAHAGKPLAPDANGTLRVTFAHVEGYRPRDGIWMEPQSRVAGVVEKQTGKEPFDAPPALLAAAPAAPASPWADSWLHDVPVCFLADADTTGGSSGSPVLNGKGELVGVNFDRVWENVANDFGFDPEVARTISVDVRYLLWTLTTLAGEAARPLLQELLPGAGGGGHAGKAGD
ncbi:MAG TPA: S46 family peptidase [Thermoanaerobaculia bacterium]|nr:S46 family peptidase [Thermoanaerobaculia bacterium]